DPDSALSVGTDQAKRIYVLGKDAKACARLVVAVFFEAGDERGGIPTLAAHRLYLGVIAVDDFSDRQLRAIAGGFFHGDAEVLAHPVDGETEVELVVDHGFPAILHLPRGGGAFADDVDYGGNIESGAFGEVKTFRQSLHETGDADLVDHLGQLTVTGRAEQTNAS